MVFGERTFLDVRQSLNGRHWVDRLSVGQDRDALAIAQKTGISDLVARILAGRGVNEDEAQAFLDPTIKQLMPDPHAMQDMEVAAHRIAQAIVHGELVAIFGDYDVDGATSSALLSRFLSAYGLSPQIYIPDRIVEGYGPNPDAIRSLVEAGAQLIVTVDCGVSSFDALDEAKKLSVDVVVLDHHQVGTDLPKATAVVNPNRHDDRSGLGNLAAVGVVFMTCVAVQRVMRQGQTNFKPADDFNLLDLLDLVALGTVCDVVPLQGLNRAFVRKGLIALRQGANVGIRALSVAARIGEVLQPYHLGFALGPRINAGGRIGDAALGARLLTLSDVIEAEEIALKLDQLNEQRRAMEKVMLEEANAQALAETGGDEDSLEPSVLLTSSDTWHPGILGLVASRLKERYSRPTFAVAFDASGKGSASGRSISGVDLGKVVRRAVDEGILLKGGGHAMAAGLTIMKDRLGDLRAFFAETLSADVTAARADRKLTIDGALTARAANLDLLDEIDRAGPYGAGHSEPIFVFPAHRISFSKVVGTGHVSATLRSEDGSTLPAICFGSEGTDLGCALLTKDRKPIHVAGTLSRNSWQGRMSVQLRILDASFVG